MKYRITVDSIEPVFSAYCHNRSCTGCDVGKHVGYSANCAAWAHNHPEEAAKLMGAEIVEDEG